MTGDFDDFEKVETYRLSHPALEEVPSRWLVVLGAAPVRVVELVVGTSLTIGRTAECDLAVADPAISRRHAALHVGRGVEIEDLGSVNGLTVAGVRVEPRGRAAVPVGSAIQIGGALLVVHAGAHPPRLDAEPRVEEPPAVLDGPPRVDPPRADGPSVLADPSMQRLYELVGRVAPTRLSVMLLGETGVGKEILAEAVHARSPRAAGPFVKINCAALAPQLLESELFGHERGAFTGADQARAGLLEAADGGTLLLDEVGDMPLELQAKLLRVLEDLLVKRIGAVTPRAIDVRFIAATNRDLSADIAQGTFRRDLYYRLNGISLQIPPLRSRPSEILPLARHFLARLGGPPRELDEALVVALLRYDWPGNVRELRNAMEQAHALSGGPRVSIEHVPLQVIDGAGDLGAVGHVAVGHVAVGHVAAPALESPPSATGELRDDLAAMEKRRIVEALARSDGNQTKAAKLLGMPRRTLISRIEAYGLPRPRKDKAGGGA